MNTEKKKPDDRMCVRTFCRALEIQPLLLDYEGEYRLWQYLIQKSRDYQTSRTRIQITKETEQTNYGRGRCTGMDIAFICQDESRFNKLYNTNERKRKYAEENLKNKESQVLQAWKDLFLMFALGIPAELECVIISYVMGVVFVLD